MDQSQLLRTLLAVALDPGFLRNVAQARLRQKALARDIYAADFSFDAAAAWRGTSPAGSSSLLRAEIERTGLVEVERLGPRGDSPTETVADEVPDLPVEAIRGPALPLPPWVLTAPIVGDAISELGRTDYHQVRAIRCIAAHAALHRFVTTKQAKQITADDVSDSTADRLLREMRDLGFLRHRGANRDRYFEPSARLLDMFRDHVRDPDEPQPA